MKTQAALASEEMVVCAGHTPPLFSFDDSRFLFLCEQDIGVVDSWIFGEEYPDLMKYGYTLSEYSALFALCRRIRKAGIVPRRIILTQYRKFVANHDIGCPSKNMGYVNTISGKGLSISKGETEPLVGDILVTRPLSLPGRVIEQYSSVHILRDLMVFVADSIDGGVLNNSQAREMMDSRFLIPAPTLGCYDGRTFMDIFSLLEQAATCFLAHGYRPREGYQRRVLGFCLERLHSYLLIKRLDSQGVRQENFGCQVVVSDTTIVQTTI